ncbi:hypothetical protein [Chryseobacterium indoltheticum]|uniref:hypothetical protein n=1 Tax=Chryseobacterium indoltheticum TaxID=254 RepID=UPI003F49603B
MKKYICLLSFLCIANIHAQIDPVKYPTYTDIKAALKSDKTVYSLSFRDKGLFNLPPDIKKMDSVFFLNMMGNNFEKLDEALFSLSQLEILISTKTALNIFRMRSISLKS